MDWLLCEDILMRNWISVLEGGYRPEADIHRSARSVPCWVRLFIGLLAGPRRPKIDWYQGDSPPYGALWKNRITGPRDPAIR